MDRLKWTETDGKWIATFEGVQVYTATIDLQQSPNWVIVSKDTPIPEITTPHLSDVCYCCEEDFVRRYLGKIRGHLFKCVNGQMPNETPMPETLPGQQLILKG